MSIRIDGTNTTANPGITGSDTDTGLQFGTNEVKVVTDGSDQVTVDSSGNVGIGTTSPKEVVDARGAVVFSGDHATSQNAYGTAHGIMLSSTSNLASIKAVSNGSNDVAIRFIPLDSGSGSEAMRLDSDGRLLVGSTSYSFAATAVLQGNSSNSGEDAVLRMHRGGTPGANADLGFISFGDNAGNLGASIRSANDSNASWGTDDYPGNLTFHTTADSASSPSERMRITHGGSVLVGSTDSSFSATGSTFTADGAAEHTRTGANVVYINRLNNDGNLIQFYGDTNFEGSISISGSTISYNGGHLTRWSQLAGGAERTEILRGSVLSNLDEMCEWAYEAQDAVLYTEEDELPEGVSVGDVKTPAVDAYTEDNEQLNRMKVSDVEGDVNVAGVFQAWDNDDDTFTNDFYCAMTGDFVIRIAQGTTVARGDLLMSAGDGTAKPQDDDIVRSKTIAKVTSTTVSTTYSDGSYCVPCVLMAC